MQPTLSISNSRSPYRFDRKKITWVLAAILSAGISACGDSGLDVGDDTARVGSDEEVGRAGDGDDPMEPDSEGVELPGDDTPVEEMAGDDSSEEGPATDNAAIDDSGADGMDSDVTIDDPSDVAMPGPVASMAPTGLLPVDPSLPWPGAAPTAMGGPIPSGFPVPTMVPPPTEPMCDVGFSNCATACVDLMLDSSNCGACGNVCAFGENCVMGVCQVGCGNGVIDAMEGCDDGNVADGDGCDSSCHPEAGFVCSEDACILVEDCGDGVVESSEACDDGNDAGGDGCFGCEVEPGWSCVVGETGGSGDAGVEGPISDCVTLCGDGVVIGAEECDNGPMNGDGVCSLGCTLQ